MQCNTKVHINAQYNAMQYIEIQCYTVHYNIKQYNAILVYIHYNRMLYNKMQCNAIYCNTKQNAVH